MYVIGYTGTSENENRRQTWWNRWSMSSRRICSHPCTRECRDLVLRQQQRSARGTVQWSFGWVPCYQLSGEIICFICLLCTLRTRKTSQSQLHFRIMIQSRLLSNSWKTVTDPKCRNTAMNDISSHQCHSRLFLWRHANRNLFRDRLNLEKKTEKTSFPIESKSFDILCPSLAGSLHQVHTVSSF